MDKTAELILDGKSCQAPHHRRHREGAGGRHLQAAQRNRLHHPRRRLRQHRLVPERRSPSSTAKRASCATAASPSRNWPRNPPSSRVAYLLIYGQLPDQRRAASAFRESAHRERAAARGHEAPLRGLPRARAPDGDPVLDDQCRRAASIPELLDDQKRRALRRRRPRACSRRCAPSRPSPTASRAACPSSIPSRTYKYTANFLHMMFSHAVRGLRAASPEVVHALDLIFLLHADHEQNCSTSTVRMVASSQANLFASAAAGVCALWGPLHGGANQAVIEMLERDPPAGDDGSQLHRRRPRTRTAASG